MKNGADSSMTTGSRIQSPGLRFSASSFFSNTVRRRTFNTGGQHYNQGRGKLERRIRDSHYGETDCIVILVDVGSPPAFVWTRKTSISAARARMRIAVSREKRETVVCSAN